jgi:surface antigen
MGRQAVLAAVAMVSMACVGVAAAQTSPSVQTQTISPTTQAPAPPASWNGSSQQALETAKSGTTVPWQNPDGSPGGVITPSPAFQDASGQTCREFQQTIMVGGQPQQAFGTACRQPDGSWRLQPAPAAAAPPGGQPLPALAYGLPPPYYYYYYPDPFFAPVFFGFGGCCFHHHFHDHFHHH